MNKKTIVILLAIVVGIVAFVLSKKGLGKAESTGRNDPLTLSTNSVSENLSSKSPQVAQRAIVPTTNESLLHSLRRLPPPKSAAEEKQRKVQAMEAATEAIVGSLNTPIAFYGKVVDQNGDPVVDANINYNAVDRFAANGSQYQGKSDAKGLFSITGIKGMHLLVGVRKEGYYPVHGKSSGTYVYAGVTSPPTTAENPAVLLLWKMGETEPLVFVSSRQVGVPKDGGAVTFDLDSGKVSFASKAGLQIESWIGDAAQPKFDWRYRISISGGGLIERKDQFDFKAPTDGYQPSIEIKMSADGEKWISEWESQYFAKFVDGTFARFSIRVYPGKRNFVVLESYFNPAPNHRNLEFDPKKVISR